MVNTIYCFTDHLVLPVHVTNDGGIFENFWEDAFIQMLHFNSLEKLYQETHVSCSLLVRVKSLFKFVGTICTMYIFAQ